MWGFYVGTDGTATGEDIDKATCIIGHESGGNPDAYNPSTATGLFQIHWLSWRVFFAKQDLTNPNDPFQNGIMAGQIFVRSGDSWSQWTTNKLC